MGRKYKGKEIEDYSNTIKYILVFKCLIRMFQNTFSQIDRAKLKRIFEKTLETRYISLLQLLAQCGNLWEEVPVHLQEKLKQYEKETETTFFVYIPNTLSDEERSEIYKSSERSNQKIIVDRLSTQLIQDKNTSFHRSIVAYNIDTFCNSMSFAGARQNAENLIVPIIPWMIEEDVLKLLEGLIDNHRSLKGYGGDQCIDCACYMIEVYKATSPKFPLLDKWQDFIKNKEWTWGGIEELKNLVYPSLNIEE